MKSMTGYGKGTSEYEGRKMTVELKSVNHRFLDLNIKLPKVFNFAEDALRKAIKERLSRGHIDVYVNYEDRRSEKNELTVDMELARKYADTAAAMREAFGLSDTLGTYELMRMPDVISEEETEDSEEILSRLLSEALAAAIDRLDVMRAREGALIKEDIVGKLAVVDAAVSELDTLSPSVIKEHMDKLRGKIQDLLGDIPIDENRLMNETVFYADKVGIDEELLRLHTHVTQFGEILAKEEPIGRQLDFLVQEMNRESNTIGSKCNEISITNKVVLLKTELEKIREQIQNIE